jgi:hypothetical protein
LPSSLPINAGAKNVGQANGQQFVKDGCTFDADCSSKCCAGNPTVDIFSPEAASKQNGKTGCGFVDPNTVATIAAARHRSRSRVSKSEKMGNTEFAAGDALMSHDLVGRRFVGQKAHIFGWAEYLLEI